MINLCFRGSVLVYESSRTRDSRKLSIELFHFMNVAFTHRPLICWLGSSWRAPWGATAPPGWGTPASSASPSRSGSSSPSASPLGTATDPSASRTATWKDALHSHSLPVTGKILKFFNFLVVVQLIHRPMRTTISWTTIWKWPNLRILPVTVHYKLG